MYSVLVPSWLEKDRIPQSFKGVVAHLSPLKDEMDQGPPFIALET
jgi:hypothetical protein